MDKYLKALIVVSAIAAVVYVYAAVEAIRIILG